MVELVGLNHAATFAPLSCNQFKSEEAGLVVEFHEISWVCILRVPNLTLFQAFKEKSVCWVRLALAANSSSNVS